MTLLRVPESLLWPFTASVRRSFIVLRLSLTGFVVAVLAGVLLPRLTQRDTRLLAHEGDEDEDVEFARLKATVQQWRAEAAQQGKPLKLPFMPFFLRNIWMGAMLLFAAITISTFFITKVWQVSRRGPYNPQRCLRTLSAGYYRRQSCRYMLGRRMLGSVRNHHGGMSSSLVLVNCPCSEKRSF